MLLFCMQGIHVFHFSFNPRSWSKFYWGLSTVSANIEVFWTFTGEIFDKQFSFPKMYLNFDASPKLRGALGTYTYGEVSSIFLGQNVAKSDIFGSKENWNYVHDIFWYQTSLYWYFWVRWRQSWLLFALFGNILCSCTGLYIYIYKMNWYFWVALKLKWYFWVAWKFLGCICAECPPGALRKKYQHLVTVQQFNRKCSLIVKRRMRQVTAVSLKFILFDNDHSRKRKHWRHSSRHKHKKCWYIWPEQIFQLFKPTLVYLQQIWIMICGNLYKGWNRIKTK